MFRILEAECPFEPTRVTAKRRLTPHIKSGNIFTRLAGKRVISFVTESSLKHLVQINLFRVMLWKHTLPTISLHNLEPRTPWWGFESNTLWPAARRSNPIMLQNSNVKNDETTMFLYFLDGNSFYNHVKELCHLIPPYCIFTLTE